MEKSDAAGDNYGTCVPPDLRRFPSQSGSCTHAGTCLGPSRPEPGRFPVPLPGRAAAAPARLRCTPSSGCGHAAGSADSPTSARPFGTPGGRDAAAPTEQAESRRRACRPAQGTRVLPAVLRRGPPVSVRPGAPAGVGVGSGGWACLWGPVSWTGELNRKQMLLTTQPTMPFSFPSVRAGCPSRRVPSAAGLAPRRPHGTASSRSCAGSRLSAAFLSLALHSARRGVPPGDRGVGVAATVSRSGGQAGAVPGSVRGRHVRPAQEQGAQGWGQRTGAPRPPSRSLSGGPFALVLGGAAGPGPWFWGAWQGLDPSAGGLCALDTRARA